MKKLLCLTGVLIAVLFSAHAVAEEVRIVYADLQRALNESKAGVRAKEELKEEAQKREQELNTQQEELKKLKEDIEKKSSVWNEETRTKKENEFQTMSQEFQNQFRKYGDELNKKKLQSEEQIIDELTEVVIELAKRDGYTFVLERSLGGIIFGPPEADITDEVIKIYNEKFEKEEL
jgi:outer membrane protein